MIDLTRCAYYLVRFYSFRNKINKKVTGPNRLKLPFTEVWE